MSGYILCQAKKAKKPYFIENISTNIYSMEELCYYLYHNLYLIDRTIINEGLCTWIAEELEFPRLAAKIRPHLGKFASAEDVLYPVFKEINYLTYEELRTLNSQLSRMDVEHPLVREKQKADAMVENGMYVNAIHVYQNILTKSGLEQAKEGLTESVYHNLGCTYSYLFQLDKALECFLGAWKCGDREEALKTYLLAYHRLYGEKEYEKMAQELRISDQMRKDIKETLNKFNKSPKPEVKSNRVDRMLEDLTREYHRSTGS